jgi:hypothetical protein
MSELKYTDESFNLVDQPKFEKWASENSDKDLNQVSSEIAQIFSYEDQQRLALGADYKGVSLPKNYDALTGPGPVDAALAEAYFAKYPHHDASLSNQTVQDYIFDIQDSGTTLNLPASQEQDESEKDSLPSEQTEEEKGNTENYWADKNPQTKDTQHLPDNPSSAHFHFLDVDINGNGWTGEPMTTENEPSSISIMHYHEVKNFVVGKELWVKKDKSATPVEDFNFIHTHQINMLTIQEEIAALKEKYIIRIKPGMFPGEPTIYRFIVSNEKTNTNVLSATIPGVDGAGTEPGTTEAEKKSLAKAYFRDLKEKYPNYTLKDTIGLFGDDGGNVEIVPESPEQEPVKIIEFDDERYSERLFIGINNLPNRVPFNSPSTMGFMLFSEKMLKDQKAGDVDWLEMLMAYTVPEVVVMPSAKDPEKRTPEPTNEADEKLSVWDSIKNSKQFAGNTAFPDLESGLNKLRGSENAFVSIYGEVLHRVNIRELLVRAMACLVAKLNPGDWVAIGCKIIVKETVKRLAGGLDELRKIMVREWNQFVRNDLSPDIRRKMEKTKAKFEKGVKNVGKAIDKMEKNIPKVIDRKKSDNLTIIDGKDPFSKEFGQIQQRELNLEKNRRLSEKAQVEEFVNDIQDFIDLDALCERFGDFINDATKLLFAPGGLGAIKMNLEQTFPGIPKPPTITLPQLPTKDIMKELTEAMERAAKELIVSSIVDLVKGIIDEALAQCEDITNPPPVLAPEKSLGIPDLVPNLVGAASPLSQNPTVSPLQYRDIEGLSIPPHLFEDVKDLLDWVSEYLKPNQLCKLLSGSASSGLLRLVLVQVEEKYERLNIYVKNITDVRNLFIVLGRKVDQTFCSAIISNVSAIADMCEDTIDNSPHEDALQKKGFSASEIKEILEADRQRKLEALEKLSDYFVDPDSIETQVPEALCRPSKDGLIPKNPRAITHNVNEVVETIFDSMKYNFELDTENFKENHIQIATVETDQFKEPEPNVDFINDLQAYPVDPLSLDNLGENASEVVGLTSDTGKYLLLSPTSGLSKQSKDIIENEIVSDGSTTGIIGPIFKKEQRRMVLPNLQKVIKDSEQYISTTHYKVNDGQIVLKNESKNPEKQTLEVSTLKAFPLEVSLNNPSFDLSDVKKVVDQLKKQQESEPDEELNERIQILEKAITSEVTKPATVSIKYSSVAESIKFDENKNVSAIEFKDLKTIRDRVLPSFEERVLGSAASENSTSNTPGYITATKINKKSTTDDNPQNKIDAGLATLVVELMKNSWLGEDDIYNSIYGNFDPTKPQDATGNTLDDFYKNTFKAFKSVLFAKLLSRNLKKTILDSYSDLDINAATTVATIKRNNLKKYMNNLENYLISIHEKSLINYTANIGFENYKNSPILNLEEFQALDLTPEDPEDLNSNNCLDPQSSGFNETLTLINIEKLKTLVRDNYERKGCVDRSPDDLNPLKESILEAGIILFIKLIFIEYCFNNIIALTDSKIFDALTTEQVKNTVIGNINFSLDNMGLDIKNSILDSSVKYLTDRIELNIDLVDPFFPSDKSLYLTEENINRTSAIDYLCKQAIVETIPVLKTIIADFDFDSQTLTGLDGFLNNYLGPTTVVDPSSARFVSNKQTPNLQEAAKIAGISLSEEYHLSLHEDDDYLLESDQYKNIENIISDMNYEDKLLSFKDDDQLGTFFLERYVRIEYLNDIGKKFFFLPETIIEIEGFNNDDRVSVLSLSDFAKVMTIQSQLHKYFRSPEISESEFTEGGGVLDSLGIQSSAFNSFVSNYMISKAGSSILNTAAIEENLNFKFGMRLVYKMPSTNLIVNEQGIPSPGLFTEEATLVEHGLFGPIEPENVDKFTQLAKKEASYLLRTMGEEDVPNVTFTAAGLGPGASNNEVSISTKTVKDHMLIPIVEVEATSLDMPQTLEGGYFTSLNIVSNPESVEKLINIFNNNNNNLNKSGLELASLFDIPSFLNADKELQYFSNKIKSAYDFPLLHNHLKNTPEVRLLTEHIFSPKEMKAMALDYMSVFPKSNIIDNKAFYSQTKRGLQSLFSACLYGDDFTYTPPGSEGFENQKRANKRGSTNINIFPSLQKLALETAPMIIKGIAETIDPAVSVANTISIAAGLPPSDINKVILGLAPPPLFPYLFYNIFPITDLGIAYMGLNFLDNQGVLISSKKKAQDKQCKDPVINEIKDENQDPESDNYETNK